MMKVTDIVVWEVFNCFIFPFIGYFSSAAGRDAIGFWGFESSRYRMYLGIGTDGGVQENFGAARSSAQFHEYGTIPEGCQAAKGSDYWPGESTYSSVMKRVRIVEELIVYQEYGMGWFRLRS